MRWHIQDWMGNICFGGIEFSTFDDGEYWLTEKLGDTYETDRGEYYIEPIEVLQCRIPD